jgi:hypothetical protein
MAKCGYCGSSILLGGTQSGQQRYCDQTCASKGALAAAGRAIPDDAARAEAARVQAGPCPKCGGTGPVDVHTSYRIWSAVYLTRWSSRPQLACRSCGVKTRVADTLFSLVFGWWGFPWGLLMTPMQVIRNIAGMLRKSDPRGPSPELLNMVRLHMAASQRRAA